MSSEVLDVRRGDRGTDAPAARRSWPERLAPWALVAVVVAVFARTVRYGLILDDAVLLRPWTLRQVLNGFHGEFDQLHYNDPYFRPFVGLNFAIEWGIWGTKVWGYRLVNIAMHAAATALVYRFARRLTGRWWAAFGGALYFAVIPSSAAEVAYVAERCDTMAALFILGGLFAVLRYHRDRRRRDAVLLVAMFLGAVLSKEIGIALAPMSLLLWWYLETERRSSGRLGGDATSVASAWVGEVRLWVAALFDPRGRRTWLALFGTMAGLSAALFAYRSWSLVNEDLGRRFGESTNPISGLLSGVKWTLKGVPWEVRGRTLVLVPFIVVAALVLDPRSRHWRTAILGGLLLVGGVLPLTFTGGVEPRLLYVAQIGTAVLAASLVAVVAGGVRSRAGDGLLARVGPRVVVSALGAVFLGLTLVGQFEAQRQFEPGSERRTRTDAELWNNLTERQIAQIPRVYIEDLEARLRERGVIGPDQTKL